MAFVVENIILIIVLMTIITFTLYLLKNRKKNHLSNNNILSHNELVIQLRAYERMILFLDRIEPVGMINRLGAHNLSADEVSAILIKNIASEYEYNVSQQIYMSNELWAMIELTKNTIINSIALLPSSLSKNSSSTDLVQQILNNPKVYNSNIIRAKKILKKEVGRLL